MPCCVHHGTSSACPALSQQLPWPPSLPKGLHAAAPAPKISPALRGSVALPYRGHCSACSHENGFCCPPGAQTPCTPNSTHVSSYFYFIFNFFFASGSQATCSQGLRASGLGKGRINVEEGGSGHAPLLVSSSIRLQTPGEDRQPRGCCFQEQHVRMAKSLRSDPRGSRGEQSCVGACPAGLSRTPAHPRSHGPTSRSRAELRVGSDQPSWKSQTSRGGQSIDREQGYTHAGIY